MVKETEQDRHHLDEMSSLVSVMSDRLPMPVFDYSETRNLNVAMLIVLRGLFCHWGCRSTSSLLSNTWIMSLCFTVFGVRREFCTCHSLCYCSVPLFFPAVSCWFINGDNSQV